MSVRTMVAEPPEVPAAASDVALDTLAFALFSVFVILLFVGYFNWDPVIPYSQLAAIPLAGALAVLIFANRRADRQAQSAGTNATG